MPTGQQLAFFILLWVFVLHSSGLYLFTRGFLLTRLSLEQANECSAPSCKLQPTHSRAIVIIIDALRFDFVSPHPPIPASPYHHNILTLPRELTLAEPRHSFLFNAFSDPPTTTLQRIKGITTGSLPTFVDIGSNFGGSAVNEDSIITQLRRQRKNIAFMGDDTWLSTFPELASSNLTHAFDSFNVEDLHTVDNGVIANMFPLLANKSSKWDFMIGHFLGVDHVGHRIGPDQPTMKTKLEQMNDVLRQVVGLLDGDTLLVVLGDHGMDRKGDHGGDGELETSSAMWIYSKSVPLSGASHNLPPSLIPMTTFPAAVDSHRRIQQIDLVPTLSLLLGLPIPFNNLGTIIPELFSRGSELKKAMTINAKQVYGYLSAYRSSSSGREFDQAWPLLHTAWQSGQISEGDNIVQQYAFTRLALETCRSLWAQFNVFLIILGLVILCSSIATAATIYTGIRSRQDDWEQWAQHVFLRSIRTGAISASVGVGLHLLFWKPLSTTISLPQSALFAFSLSSSLQCISSTQLPFGPISISSFIPIILHALAFLSNSFILWEDKLVTFLLITIAGSRALSALSAPTAHLRKRLLFFSAVFALCIRLIAISTVCREEQHPYCSVTFYASSSVPSPPLLVILICVPTSLILPSAIRRFLMISKSDQGAAPLFLEWFMRVALLLGNLCWILEWVESVNYFGDGSAWALRGARTIFARLAMGGTVLGGFTLWWFAPLCLNIKTKVVGEVGKKEVVVIGFANSYGSSYLLFLTLFFSILSIGTQLTGQVVLALTFIAILANIEIVDSLRDATLSRSPFNSPTFPEITPVALLALHAFYATGHQSTLASLQWKTAFLLTPTLSYPLSPILVILNTFGPHMLIGLSAPLLALWAVPPLPHPQQNNSVTAKVLCVALCLGSYFCTLLVGIALSSAWLRRHLMVWKVFAPRFMSAGAAVLAIDLALMMGVLVGLGRVLHNVKQLFGPK